jgi:membrane-bound lytic murein transglycosylase D
LEGTSVYDLAPLKEPVLEILPILKGFEETKPYADWIESHLDYFDAAQQLEKEMAPTPPKPGRPAPPPSPRAQANVWQKKMSNRPIPAAAQPYVPQLKRIFASEKVPAELVWLAEVESSFNPKARSPAGAAGLFQLMPVTARSLGLSRWPRDERLQPEKNARAAAQYLRRLHGRFGQWPLALAAYNAGETRVDALLKQGKNRSFEAIAGRLPAETQLYVPKVEATLRKREGQAFSDLKIPAANQAQPKDFCSL